MPSVLALFAHPDDIEFMMAGTLLLLGTMVPQESIVYPIYYMAKAVGLYDTQLAVIIVIAVPFFVALFSAWWWRSGWRRGLGRLRSC